MLSIYSMCAYYFHIFLVFFPSSFTSQTSTKSEERYITFTHLDATFDGIHVNYSVLYTICL